ncbi:MAG: V-type ATP synthase subunit I, partial [Halobaculum sp.]
MLRPERMSKVSVTGSRQVVEPVVEAVHDLNLVHLTDYDGGWDGFDPGVSTEGAEAAADKLVTVRSLESILDVDDADAGERRVVSDEALEEDLTEAQTAVNEVADRRDEIRDELRDVRERMEALEPFVELGIDLDLLSGYDALDVAVGYGDSEDVRERLQRGPFDEFQLFTEDDVLAVFARPTDPTTALADELVGASFAAVEIPDVDEQTAPGTYLAELSNRREELDAELDRIETEFDRLRGEWGSFLLAAEEELSIRVAKAEAPLSFATTEHAFVAEGWVPTEQYTELDAAITEAVGDRAEVEELQRATFGHGGEVELREDVPPAVREAGTEPADEEETEREPPRAAADGGSEDDRAVTDGGTAASPVVMRDDEPPTVQDNPGPAGPFELLTRLVGTPSYSELDPTIILTLTFPLMFGFMVGDVGYGLIYTGIGFWIASRFDSDTFQSMATITVVAGLATTVFGVLYGEVFGTHLVSTVLWEGALGLKHPPIEKGLSPATREWAETWFVVSVLFGVVHLNVGYVFEFVENLQLHGIVEALEETGSWILV